MAKEIERKFLVKDARWRGPAQGMHCRQGYLVVGPPVAVRARIMGGKATVNIKSAMCGIERDEFEYTVPEEDATQILDGLCIGHVIEKVRYTVDYAGHTWEIDEFHGVNEGLMVAEIELEDSGETFERPPWIGDEVSGDPRYLNANLALHPYTLW